MAWERAGEGVVTALPSSAAPWRKGKHIRGEEEEEEGRLWCGSTGTVFATVSAAGTGQGAVASLCSSLRCQQGGDRGHGVGMEGPVSWQLLHVLWPHSCSEMGTPTHRYPLGGLFRGF